MSGLEAKAREIGARLIDPVIPPQYHHDGAFIDWLAGGWLDPPESDRPVGRAEDAALDVGVGARPMVWIRKVAERSIRIRRKCHPKQVPSPLGLKLGLTEPGLGETSPVG